MYNSLFVSNQIAGIEFKLIGDGERYDQERGSLVKDTVIVAGTETDGIVGDTTTKTAVIFPYALTMLMDGLTFINFDRPGMII